MSFVHSHRFALAGACRDGDSKETLLVGDPLMKQVKLFQGNGTIDQWTECHTLSAMQEYFGARLHNLGPLSGGSFDVVAIANMQNPFWATSTTTTYNSVVRFYGAEPGGVGSGDPESDALGLRQILISDIPATAGTTVGQSFGGTFGYEIVPVGNFDGSPGSEIAILSPMAWIKGREAAGEVRIIAWEALGNPYDGDYNNEHAGKVPEHVEHIIGSPNGNALFGTSILSVFDPFGDGESISSEKPRFTVIGRPSSKFVDPAATYAATDDADPIIDDGVPESCPYPQTADGHRYYALDPNTTVCWIWHLDGYPGVHEPNSSLCQGIVHHVSINEAAYQIDECKPIYGPQPSTTNGGITTVAQGVTPTGSLQIFAEVKLAPGAPYKLTGQNSNARFGRSFAAVPDVDLDGVNDFMVAQPGGRCGGAAFGAVSLISIQDFELTKSICGYASYDQLGFEMHYLGNREQLLFLRHPQAKEPHNISTPEDDIGIHAMRLTAPIDAPESWKSPFLTSQTRFDLSNVYNTHDATLGFGQRDLGYSRLGVIAGGSYSLTSPRKLADQTIAGVGNQAADAFILGEPEAKRGADVVGAIHVVVYGEDASGVAIFDKRCLIEGAADGDGFGTSASFMDDIDGDDWPEILVGAPGAGDLGTVYLIKGSYAFSNCNPSSDPKPRINPNDQIMVLAHWTPSSNTLLGETAQAGFGSFVLGLSDYDKVGPKVGYVVLPRYASAKVSA